MRLSAYCRFFLPSSSLQDAVRLLREALSLAPRNPTVLATFHALQEDANIPPLSKLASKFAIDGNETAGREALQLILDPSISLATETAVECVQLLMSQVGDSPPSPLRGKLVGEILRASPGARERVADRLNENHLAVLQLFDQLGEDAIDGAVAVLLDPIAWRGATETGARCLRECFRWFLSRLQAAEGVCIARSVARLLASRAEDIHSCVSQTGLEQLLGLLDLNSPSDLRSHATLATAKFVETSADVGQSMVGKFVASRLAAEGDEDLRLAFSVAAAIFPLLPQFTAQLFLTEGFVEGLVPLLQARPEDVEAAALEMLSAACVDQACRTAIATHCSEYLDALVKSGDSARPAAAVVLAKVRCTPGGGPEARQRDMDRLAGVFKGMMLEEDGDARDSSVEGLAYTSLKGSVKELLVRDRAFVGGLVETLKASIGKPTVMFGALTVVANLTIYPPTLSEEQRKVAELKNYAETKPKPKTEPDPEDKEERVTARCSILIDAGIVPALAACSKKITPNAIGTVANILLSLSKHQRHRGTIASQGGVKLALQSCASALGNTAQDRSIQQASAHALARILVSVNPSHVFSSQLAISSAVRPLLGLLGDTEDQKDLLPLFESLLALTNLASTEDGGIGDQIIRTGWTKIEELLLHSNVMVQRAAVELVCNLMTSPAGVAKFADGSKTASNRLHILLALADAEDFATRRAAGGAVAMLTEWDKACEAVAGRERGIRIVLDMVAEDNDEIRHRGVVVLRNLVCGLGKYGKEVKAEGGIEVLRDALKGTRQPQVLSVGVEALKALMDI